MPDVTNGDSCRPTPRGPLQPIKGCAGTKPHRSELTRAGLAHERVTGGETPGTSGYADSCPVHLVSSASLALLNDELVAVGDRAVPMARFRPNIVLTGDDAHVEDRIRRVRIGGAELGFAKPAVRCAVTTIDQDAGRRSGPAVLRALAGYRRAEDGLVFGTKFAVLRTGTLAIGDPLSVTEWGPPVL